MKAKLAGRGYFVILPDSKRLEKEVLQDWRIG
jgi:hypothetical protein